MTDPPTTDTDTATDIDSDIDRDEVPDDLACYCELSDLIDVLSRKYAIQLICAIGLLEPARYRDIEDAFGDVSSSTLSARLDELTDANILKRDRYDEIPPRVEYHLTPEGNELRDHLTPLLDWIHTTQ